MNRSLLVVGLAIVLSVGSWARGQDMDDADQPPENPRHALELQRRQLELDQRRAEFQFNNDVRKIELEKKRLELERLRQAPEGRDSKECPMQAGWRGSHHKMMALHCALFMLGCFIVHSLLAIWVYQDIRRRNAGSGLWIVITLLTGFFGALVYAVVRLGDKPPAA